ncbi:NHL repeat-containing protein [Pseudochryseolinea flava]|uniref:Bulb-type lectin domain-containing protein n=1 Tax=Pseudochryseolinea flava TaxID=2059302 RepID=A0A364XYL6_9BACT|nr:hypothetical protein [Pseudochryseolinea flava]RAV98516.1 hypothetical protein DQQ10_23635 [Pseudochryseolinea flava]
MNKSIKLFLGFPLLIAAMLFLNACSSDSDPEPDPNPEPEPEVPSNKTPFLKKIGGTGDDYISASITDDKGNLYVTGAFNGTASFGKSDLTSLGGVDAYVAKYNTNGDLIWVVPIAGTQYSYGRALTFDKAGNVCVVGDFNGTVNVAGTNLTAFGQYNTFIVRVTLAGVLVSAIRDGIGTANSGSSGLTWPRAVTFDSDGNMYMAGSFYYEAKFGNLSVIGDPDMDGQMFVVKYNPDGSAAWVQKSSAGANASGIAVSPSSALVYVTGTLYGKSSFGATELTSKGEGDVLLVGYQIENGAVNSAQNFGGTGGDGATDIAFDQYGQIFLVGYFTGQATFGKYTLDAGAYNDMFLFRVGNGGYYWTKQLKGYAMANDLMINNNGIYVTGWFSNKVTFGSTDVTSRGSLDAFAMKYSLGGTVQWYGTAGGTGNDRGESVATDALGNVFMSGDFQSTIHYGEKNVASAGATDAMMVKYVMD